MVELTAPLPTDRDECRELLDEVCLALWGGQEWVKPERRARNLPRSWKPRVAPVPAEWAL